MIVRRLDREIIIDITGTKPIWHATTRPTGMPQQILRVAPDLSVTWTDPACYGCIIPVLKDALLRSCRPLRQVAEDRRSRLGIEVGGFRYTIARAQSGVPELFHGKWFRVTSHSRVRPLSYPWTAEEAAGTVAHDIALTLLYRIGRAPQGSSYNCGRCLPGGWEARRERWRKQDLEWDERMRRLTSTASALG